MIRIIAGLSIFFIKAHSFRASLWREDEETDTSCPYINASAGTLGAALSVPLSAVRQKRARRLHQGLELGPGFHTAHATSPGLTYIPRHVGSIVGQLALG
jgi:hypothetical protein